MVVLLVLVLSLSLSSSVLVEKSAGTGKESSSFFLFRVFYLNFCGEKGRHFQSTEVQFVLSFNALSLSLKDLLNRKRRLFPD